jgi:hypothetical protein
MLIEGDEAAAFALSEAEMGTPTRNFIRRDHTFNGDLAGKLHAIWITPPFCELARRSRLQKGHKTSAF